MGVYIKHILYVSEILYLFITFFTFLFITFYLLNCNFVSVETFLFKTSGWIHLQIEESNVELIPPDKRELLEKLRDGTVKETVYLNVRIKPTIYVFIML